MTDSKPLPLSLSARTFLGKVWALSRPYWVSEERWIALALLVSVLALSLFQIYLSVQLNTWYNDFYNSLQDKRGDDAWVLLNYFCFLASVYIVSAGYNQYLNMYLQIRWRRWLTRTYLDDWLGARVYYRMEIKNYGTDNVDQRIQEDVRDFASLTLSLTLDFISSVVTLISFAGILWGLSGAISLDSIGLPVSIPGYMMWVAIAYAAVGTWLTHRVGYPLTGLNFNQQRFEADFRYGLVRLRENAEGIAHFGGEAAEKTALLHRFGHVWQNWWQIMTCQKHLVWFQSGYNQLAVVFPFFVSLPRYFAGAIQLGQVMQISSAFGQVQGALSWFVGAYSQLASWKATVDRLTTFHEAIERAVAEAHAHIGIEVAATSDPAISLSGVTVNLPDGRPLVTATSLTLDPGRSVLVTGPSGSGKSTLFRAISGIWPFGRGRVALPASGRMMFVPQKPYLPIGTLRSATAYPAAPESCTDEALRAALEKVNLGHFVERLDESDNWAVRLSPGEQQRLAIARVLVSRPQWIFLDEATSALDEGNEQWLYSMLAQELPDATVISIAHRPSVAAHHRRLITLRTEAPGVATVFEAVN